MLDYFRKVVDLGIVVEGSVEGQRSEMKELGDNPKVTNKQANLRGSKPAWRYENNDIGCTTMCIDNPDPYYHLVSRPGDNAEQ